MCVDYYFVNSFTRFVTYGLLAAVSDETNLLTN